MSVAAARLKVARALALYRAAARDHFEGNFERCQVQREMAKKDLLRVSLEGLPTITKTFVVGDVRRFAEAAARAKADEMDEKAWRAALAEASGEVLEEPAP